MRAYYAARAPEYDDVYLRQGPLESLSFQAELDAATLWLDALPIAGEIVELAAGTGWWSPLLAEKGELWLHDAVEEPLELARRRLVAHGLRAHTHVRNAWAEPDRLVDALFTGFWLSHVRRARLGEFAALARRWLKPGGMFAFIDEAPAETGPPVTAETEARTVGDRSFTIVKVRYSAAELVAALTGAGFADVDVRATGRHFLLGRATAG
jgi:demethylmenaquinone methyltransferase/2-methoxy-6-polyprenyl-1,4-benzoquinol methylase